MLWDVIGKWLRKREEKFGCFMGILLRLTSLFISFLGKFPWYDFFLVSSYSLFFEVTDSHLKHGYMFPIIIKVKKLVRTYLYPHFIEIEEIFSMIFWPPYEGFFMLYYMLFWLNVLVLLLPFLVRLLLLKNCYYYGWVFKHMQVKNL